MFYSLFFLPNVNNIVYIFTTTEYWWWFPGLKSTELLSASLCSR